jgi:hypothetical protein
MNRLSFIALLFFLPLASLVADAQNARQDARPTIAPEYYTRYGDLSFKSEGRQFVGTYPYRNGRISGKLEGNELKGTWRQSDGGGSIVITFSPDFSTFEARYNYTGTPDNWATGWSGTRKPEAQSREYETLWGVMKCDFEGSQVACAYPWFNGKVLGQLKGRALTGMWLQADGGSGNLRLTFAEDFNSFNGTYNDFNLHPDSWYEWSGVIRK